MAAQRVKAIELTFLDVSTSPAAWAQVGSTLPNACSVLRIINDSNVGAVISYDEGVTSHDFVDAADTIQLPVQGSPLPSSGNVWQFPKGFKVYANPNVAGVGFIYLVGYYQD